MQDGSLIHLLGIGAKQFFCELSYQKLFTVASNVYRVSATQH